MNLAKTNLRKLEKLLDLGNVVDDTIPMSNTDTREGQDGMTCNKCDQVIEWGNLKAHAEIETFMEAKANELVATIKAIAETTDTEHQAQLAYNAFAYMAGQA